MDPDTPGTALKSASLLSRAKAAAHIGFVPKTFERWVAAGLLPDAEPGGTNWNALDLSIALGRLIEFGYPRDKRGGKRDYIPLPNVQRPSKTLSEGRRQYYFRHRKTGRSLPREWGSPEFMNALIECERSFAVQQHALASSDQKTGHIKSEAQPQAAPSPDGQVLPPEPSPPMAPLKFFTEKEVAMLFRASVRTFREKTRPYRFPIQLGRSRLYTAEDIVRLSEVLRCHSNSSRPANANPPIGRYAERTSANMWTEAQRMLSEPSQRKCLPNGNAK